MNDTLKFIVPGKPEYIGPVRIAISMVAADMGFAVDAIEDIKMAVSEACSTAICPGAAGLSDFICHIVQRGTARDESAPSQRSSRYRTMASIPPSVRIGSPSEGKCFLLAFT